MRNLPPILASKLPPGYKAHTAKLDLRRLRFSLAAAAARAGYQGWWLVDDLIEGVACYLRSDPTVPLSDNKLVAMIQSMLEAVGYQEISLHYQNLSPGHSVSLVECLHGMAQSDRTRFFDKLAEEISLLHAARARQIHFCDLRECVHELQRACSCSRTPDSKYQLGSVVAFIREHVQDLWRSQEVQCSIV